MTLLIIVIQSLGSDGFSMYSVMLIPIVLSGLWYLIKVKIMEHVGIVILNYNNSSDTINCIESVLKYTTVPIKIVVVDNGSNDVNSIIEISNYLTENVKKEEYVDINVKKVSPILLPKITLLN